MKLPKLTGAKGDRLNECEAAFERMTLAKGYTVTKKGWPDFLCEKDGEYVVVEIKPRTKKGRSGHLKYDQVLVMIFFTKLGVRCYVSDGAECEPFSIKQHASKKALKRLGLSRS